MKKLAASTPVFYLTPLGVQSFEDMSDLEDESGRIVIECADGESLVLERVEFR